MCHCPMENRRASRFPPRYFFICGYGSDPGRLIPTLRPTDTLRLAATPPVGSWLGFGAGEAAAPRRQQGLGFFLRSGFTPIFGFSRTAGGGGG